eukprot:337727-Prorocentrum_minimum.AAC.1
MSAFLHPLREIILAKLRTRTPSQLRKLGVKTIWGDPKEMAKATSDGKFDVVVENNGKKLDEVMPVADWAKHMGTSELDSTTSVPIRALYSTALVMSYRRR